VRKNKNKVETKKCIRSTAVDPTFPLSKNGRENLVDSERGRTKWQLKREREASDVAGVSGAKVSTGGDRGMRRVTPPSLCALSRGRWKAP
jgi:hypothetical protein